MTNPESAVESSPLSRRLLLGSALAGAAAVAAPIATAPRAEAATYITRANAYYSYWTARYRYAGRVPYVYGGMSPRSGFDCSGMTKYLYSLRGVYLPRSANDQYRYVRKISRASAHPGDLVFYVNSSGRATHVGLYGYYDNRMVDAGNPSVDVSYRRIWYGTRVVFGTRRY